MKEFNTTGVCIPSKHYMVDLSDKVAEIGKMVDEQKYFTINRARQYGKTTTLNALRKALGSRYNVILIDFQGIDADAFCSGATFSQAFARQIIDLHEFQGAQIPPEIVGALQAFATADPRQIKMDELFRVFKRWIQGSPQPIVLMIDEVDSASSNQVFPDFLSQLRKDYISRETSGGPAFQSVILAGVTDVKHLKSRIREDEQHKVNSPWNIAADFNVDMSLSASGIQGMLDEYEADHHTGMNTGEIAKLIREL